MNDLISRKGVSAWLYNMGHEKLSKYVLDEKRFPSVNRQQGKWINGSFTNGTYYKKCNQCFAVINETFFAYNFNINFCPNCGAYMKKGIDNEIN